MGEHGHQSSGECLKDYLVCTYLKILNKGNDPLFVISTRKEVIDFTPRTDKTGGVLTNWHGSNEISVRPQICSIASA
jgi:hypothetical protein